MKKLFVFILLLCSNALFCDDLICEKKDEVKEFNLPYGDTYMPLDNELKDSVYWSIKTGMWGVSLGFFTTIYVTPFLEKDEHKVAVWNYYSRHCHQMMTRTMRYKCKCITQTPDNDFPVCARCQGMYTGYALGFLDSFIWDSFSIEGLERWEKGLVHISSYSLLLVPLLIDGYTQKNTSYVSNNPWRFINGMMFGYAITAIFDEALQLVLDYENKFEK